MASSPDDAPLGPLSRSEGAPGRPSDEDVLAAVSELSTPEGGPGTSTITWHLAGGQADSGALHAAVHDVLRHLEAAGRVTRVTSGGTHRWSPNQNQSAGSGAQPAARPSTSNGTRWPRELARAVALTYAIVVLVCLAAGYVFGRMFL